MTNNDFSRITPADVAYVPASELAIGDTIVRFASAGAHNDTAPTARQLKRATFITIRTMTERTSPKSGLVIVELNAGDSDAVLLVRDRVSSWRVAR
jgi:hypothetical protein